jgi:lysozyme
MAKIECKYCYALTENGKNIAFFNEIDTDSVLVNLTYKETSAIRTVNHNAYWINKFQLIPWCNGRLLTRFSLKTEEGIVNFTNSNLPYIIGKEKKLLAQKETDLKSEVAELKYYLSRHNVQDEGFNTISIFDTKIKADLDTIQKLSEIINAISDLSKVKVKYVPHYTAIYQGKSLRNKRVPCVPLTEESQNGNKILQTTNHHTPDGVRPLSTYQFRKYGKIGVGEEVNKAPKQEKPLNGHGVFISPNGDYYEGRWENGKRNGFGFSISPSHNVRAGEWKDDKYLGEKMIYTSERIYGIDISRYQHIAKIPAYYVDKNGKRRKKIKTRVVPIEWSKLRITHLGNISKKTVNGSVDYPISFVYIKSTEGKSLCNPYYGYDYKMARRYGFHVGAYHFFSPSTNAKLQAKFFLRYTLLRRGDLPPVLDVEPTIAQIKKIGGKNVLLNRVVEWLKIVENHTGIKPVLYVNQKFVNSYLNDASYIKSNYQIWIARYGEYKPDVKLIYWQLCPDGRVSGIKGDVDINVFNGYRTQFDDFVCKRKYKINHSSIYTDYTLVDYSRKIGKKDYILRFYI